MAKYLRETDTVFGRPYLPKDPDATPTGKQAIAASYFIVGLGPVSQSQSNLQILADGTGNAELVVVNSDIVIGVAIIAPDGEILESIHAH